jgi:hypothetical protein
MNPDVNRKRNVVVIWSGGAKGKMPDVLVVRNYLAGKRVGRSIVHRTVPMQLTGEILGGVGGRGGDRRRDKKTLRRRVSRRPGGG